MKFKFIAFLSYKNNPTKLLFFSKTAPPMLPGPPPAPAPHMNPAFFNQGPGPQGPTPGGPPSGYGGPPTGPRV